MTDEEKLAIDDEAAHLNRLWGHIDAEEWCREMLIGRDRIAALEAENARLRTELERLRQPYSELSYDEWSALEDAQDWRNLAWAFESDAHAKHDIINTLQQRLLEAAELHLADEATIYQLERKLAQQWQPVDDQRMGLAQEE